MDKLNLNRRSVMTAATAATAGAAAAVIALVSSSQASGFQSPDRVQQVSGEKFSAIADSNPLEAKITVFTTVSADVDASVAFYRDVIGMTVVSDAAVSPDLSSRPASECHHVVTY